MKHVYLFPPRNGARAATFQRILRPVALWWWIVLLLAGCLRGNLTPTSQPMAPLPGPGRVLVYDRVVAPEEIVRHPSGTTNDRG